MNSIDASGLSKSYVRGDIVSHVLRDIDLSADSGECIVLAGPSGSGKTTLLSLLGCILRPDAGRLKLLGRDVERMRSSELAVFRRNEIGFLFQRLHLIRGLSALENVTVPLLLNGLKERAARKSATARLAAVGLDGMERCDPRRMSVGQCQRIALARALANDPRIILADEPTASLDAESGQAVMQLLQRLLREEQRTAIVVTHDVRVFPYADRVLHLQDGRFLADSPTGTPTEPAPPPGRVGASSLPPLVNYRVEDFVHV
jgi:putative ABC transport system ATP-binding protein